MTPSDEAIRAAVLTLALERGRGRSLCPSEAARALAVDWRAVMAAVCRGGAAMPEVRATRRGHEVPADAPGGPIRLSLR